MTNEEQVIEIVKCFQSPVYFIKNYVHILDSVERDWIKFDLWPAQEEAIWKIHSNQQTIILKARQIGLTWCLLGYSLWSMLFQPVAEVLLFSKRDDEAVNLLDNRFKGIYKLLPEWLKTKVVIDNTHAYGFSNGSTARAFPTTGGDSYTATLAIVDEADLVPNFNALTRAVKPTIDNGGKFVLLSRADKDTPNSEFKKIFRASVSGKNSWSNIFLPWNVHPKRSPEWYNRQVADSMEQTGGMDFVYEQYPATIEQALLPKSLNKRLPGQWILNNYNELPAIDSLSDIIKVIKPFEAGKKYVIGADPAEGNPTSDPSVAIVTNKNTGEEVAYISGQYEPSVFSAYVYAMHLMYGKAYILVERNNHGHAVILWFTETYPDEEILLLGYDDKIGWLSNSYGKVKMYTDFADLLRTRGLIIHHKETLDQLSSIDGKTLKAPDGEFDDFAMAYVLSQMARTLELSGDNFDMMLGGNKMYDNKR